MELQQIDNPTHYNDERAVYLKYTNRIKLAKYVSLRSCLFRIDDIHLDYLICNCRVMDPWIGEKYGAIPIEGGLHKISFGLNDLKYLREIKRVSKFKVGDKFYFTNYGKGSLLEITGFSYNPWNSNRIMDGFSTWQGCYHLYRYGMRYDYYAKYFIINKKK